MSRVHLKASNPNHEVVVGLDHATGWFIQVFDLKAEDETGEETLLINKDALFTPNFGRGEMLSHIQQYADMSDARTAQAASNIAMDLDPAAGLPEATS
jgi:hypothetical protein